MVVIQSRYAVGELSGVALIGAQAALHVALVAIRSVELLPQDGARTEAENHAAQRVGQIIGGARAIAPADQMAGDALIVDLALLRAAARGRAFFQVNRTHQIGSLGSLYRQQEQTTPPSLSWITSTNPRISEPLSIAQRERNMDIDLRHLSFQ